MIRGICSIIRNCLGYSDSETTALSRSRAFASSRSSTLTTERPRKTSKFLSMRKYSQPSTCFWQRASSTLYQILTGVLSSFQSESDEQGDAASGQGSEEGLANMTVMQNLAHQQGLGRGSSEPYSRASSTLLKGNPASRSFPNVILCLRCRL